MRTLVLVLSAFRRPYPDLIRAQKRTWAARDVEDIDVLFYYGDAAKEAVHGRDLFVVAPDDFSGIGQKTLACFEYVLAHRDFDLVFRTNASSYVDLPNLRAWIGGHARPTGFYAGIAGFDPRLRDAPFASGSGYFLSRDLVASVVRMRSSWNHGLIDDVALAELLAGIGVVPEPTPRLDLRDVRQAREIDTSQFHFRCKTDSSWRRGDIDLMLAVDEAFARSRGELHQRWYTPARRLKMAVRAAEGLPLRGARAVRHRARAAALRARPLRPPLDDPAAVAELGRTPESRSFITGNGLAASCRYVLNYDELSVNEEVENDWWFCKVDFLEYFFRELAPDSPFVLFSHNGDRPIDRSFERQLRRRELVAWFAANAALDHPKLLAFPLGIANPKWPHGDGAAIEAVRRARVPKTRLFDASFSVDTNLAERRHCVAQTGLDPAPRRGFDEYLRELASSYFCISPRGNGIDTHRTWEALYVGTIPVVTRSPLTDQHPDLPMVVLDDWAEFGSIEFSPELYERTWGSWDADAIRLDRYLERVEEIIEGRRGVPRERRPAANRPG